MHSKVPTWANGRLGLEKTIYALKYFVLKEIRNNRALLINRIRNAFPLRSITPNYSVSGLLNDLLLSFLQNLGVYKTLKNESTQFKAIPMQK